MVASDSWVYEAGPSREEVDTSPFYRRTRDYYNFVLQNGRFLSKLEDLMECPAPIVCPCCEKGVITNTVDQRTGDHWFKIVMASIFTLGLASYPTYKSSRFVVHKCPSCGSRLAIVNPVYSGVCNVQPLQHYDGEDDTPGDSRFTQINVGGHTYLQHNNQWNTQMNDQSSNQWNNQRTTNLNDHSNNHWNNQRTTHLNDHSNNRWYDQRSNQWNNHNSKVANQTGAVDTQHQQMSLNGSGQEGHP